MTKSVIEADLTVEGDIRANGGDVAIKGKVKGDVSAKSVEVLSGSDVSGAVKADNVIVEGRLNGSIECKEVTLRGSSDVTADVNAGSMVSEKGGKLVGSVRINGA